MRQHELATWEKYREGASEGCRRRRMWQHWSGSGKKIACFPLRKKRLRKLVPITNKTNKDAKKNLDGEDSGTHFSGIHHIKSQVSQILNKKKWNGKMEQSQTPNCKSKQKKMHFLLLKFSSPPRVKLLQHSSPKSPQQQSELMDGSMDPPRPSKACNSTSQ